MVTTIAARDASALSLSESVKQALKRWFTELKGNEMIDLQKVDLYKLVIEEIEPILLQMSMEYSRYNQSRAAWLLGMSRGTLRQRLRKYFSDKYVGTRGEKD